MPGILVIFETRGNNPLPVCAELGAAATKLSGSVYAEISVLCPVERWHESHFQSLVGFADFLLVAEHEQFLLGNPQQVAQLASALCLENNFEYILLPHTIDGAATAGALAAKLRVNCIPGVTKIESESGEASFVSSILGGKLSVETEPTSNPAVITVATGAFKEADPTSGELPPLAYIDQKQFPATPLVNTLELREQERTDRTLQQADVIVSVGRGIGKEENIELIEQLAALFDKSAIGASRPICDYGWLPHSHQVGITGRSVSPSLYLACGISGSSQHLAGIRKAEFIVAINRDPEAAIFAVADIAVSDDLHQFIPALIDQYKKHG
jgi:electron transfer flavoprotein alpha subunit